MDVLLSMVWAMSGPRAQAISSVVCDAFARRWMIFYVTLPTPEVVTMVNILITCVVKIARKQIFDTNDLL